MSAHAEVSAGKDPIAGTRRFLIRFGSGVAVAFVILFALLPWVNGPAAVGFAVFGSTVASDVVDNRLIRRRTSWSATLGSGVAIGIVIWFLLRWLKG